ncbi:MAG: hypothetical protein KAI24_22170 [Planctomycetes bacterium]|nr:hypothetical protein [Planctomycetota bacterium]
MAADRPTLTPFEAAILAQICADQKSLRKWSCAAVVESREFTGAGSYTCFVGAPAVGERTIVRLRGFFEVPGVALGLGAALFCRGGLPEFLEVFTYGEEPWDGSAEEFVFHAG